MSFLSIPTDNLYKFMALSGLVLIILSFIPFDYKYKSELEKIELSGQMEINRSEIDNYKNRLDIIMQTMKITQSDINKLNLLRNKTELMDEKYFQRYLEFEKQLNQFTDYLLTLTLKQYDDYIKIKVNTIEIEKKKNKIEYINERINILSVISIIGVIIGTLLSIIGFVLWYTRCQKYLDHSVQNVKDLV